MQFCIAENRIQFRIRLSLIKKHFVLRWGILEIETFGDGFEPELQAYAAGLLEGLFLKNLLRSVIRIFKRFALILAKSSKNTNLFSALNSKNSNLIHCRFTTRSWISGNLLFILHKTNKNKKGNNECSELNNELMSNECRHPHGRIIES